MPDYCQSMGLKRQAGDKIVQARMHSGQLHLSNQEQKALFCTRHTVQSDKSDSTWHKIDDYLQATTSPVALSGRVSTHFDTDLSLSHSAWRPCPVWQPGSPIERASAVKPWSWILPQSSARG